MNNEIAPKETIVEERKEVKRGKGNPNFKKGSKNPYANKIMETVKKRIK